jgi:hypothetical protein
MSANLPDLPEGWDQGVKEVIRQIEQATGALEYHSRQVADAALTPAGVAERIAPDVAAAIARNERLAEESRRHLAAARKAIEDMPSAS